MEGQDFSYGHGSRRLGFVCNSFIHYARMALIRFPLLNAGLSYYYSKVCFIVGSALGTGIAYKRAIPLPTSAHQKYTNVLVILPF